VGLGLSPELVERLAEWNDERKETAYSNVDFSSLDVEDAWVHRGRVPARG
jgi:hypothetical protein